MLLALSEMFPKAPIYTAFYRKNSVAFKRFKDKDIRPSWVHYIPFFNKYLHSPLRFLAPLIWGSFDFRDFDLVITSASWYVTKGMRKGTKTTEICYCHTPPRWLYGYPTSIEWQKYWPVRIYAAVVGHFMRIYDFRSAQKVDFFLTNSENVRARIKKYYRREAKVIYPPIEISKVPNVVKKDYYLIISRIVGGKGLDLAIKAARKLDIKLKIVGEPAGYYTEYKKLSKMAQKNIQFLGHVGDIELAKLYKQAKAFFALATDEDFGMTPVEANLAGTAVIAFRGGGYTESIVDGKTGIFFDEPTVDSLVRAIRKFEKSNIKSSDCIKQAKKFSKERFQKEMKKFVKKHA